MYDICLIITPNLIDKTHLNLQTYKQRIFNINSDADFDLLKQWAFDYQLVNNPIFKDWCSQFDLRDFGLPFLPIDFFKTHQVVSGDINPVKVFKSSGTTGATTSQHLVADLALYEESFTRCFELFYGSISNYAILALLPNYLEQGESSLVYMVEQLMKKSGHKANGFYLYELDELVEVLQILSIENQSFILFGVSFALLDLVEQYELNLKNAIVIETGGMKGRRKEITRQELHGALTKGLGVGNIHSEYGMSELLSQAYSKGEGIYYCPPWMRVFVTDVNDPMQILEAGQTGILNIIDLANINSCCFIKTSDLGRCHADGGFEVLGRMDNSDVRGCNLLVG